MVGPARASVKTIFALHANEVRMVGPARASVKIIFAPHANEVRMVGVERVELPTPTMSM